MWRRDRFPGEQDSDECISDEEEYDIGCSERCVSLDASAKKEEPYLAVQFELLKGSGEANERRTHNTNEKTAGYSSEDEVEMPTFHDRVDCDGEKDSNESNSTCSVSMTSWSEVQRKLRFSGKVKGGSSAAVASGFEVTAKTDLPSAGHENQLKDCTKFAVNRQADRFVQSSKNVDTMLEQPSNFEGTSFNEDALAHEGASGHEFAKHSMADLLDGLQEKNSGRYAIPKMVLRRRKGGRVGVHGNTSKTGKRIINDEDPCENIDSGSSSDNEEEVRNKGLTTAEADRKTIADQFQEAIGATSLTVGADLVIPKLSSGGGFLGKLQRVIQREKEQDLKFLKILHSEGPKDEAGYIDVKILSRSFEAKLTVCLCSINEYRKTSVLIENSEEGIAVSTRTVIFNSRACGDVDLDAGNFIRIYPPCYVVSRGSPRPQLPCSLESRERSSSSRRRRHHFGIILHQFTHILTYGGGRGRCGGAAAL